jgi:hypothetical protein
LLRFARRSVNNWRELHTRDNALSSARAHRPPSASLSPSRSFSLAAYRSLQSHSFHYRSIHRRFRVSSPIAVGDDDDYGDGSNPL